MATVRIVPDSTLIENAEFGVYFIWDVPVTRFTADDVTLSIGTKGALTGSAGVYRLEVTPPSSGTGNMTVTVAENAVTETNSVASQVIAYGQTRLVSSIFAPDINGTNLAYNANWVYAVADDSNFILRYTHAGVSAGQSDLLPSAFGTRPDAIAIFGDRFLLEYTEDTELGLYRTTNLVSATDLLAAADGLGSFSVESEVSFNVTQNTNISFQVEVDDIAVGVDKVFVLYSDADRQFN